MARGLLTSRSLRVAVLLWIAAFFIIVLPGHRRGIVQLPGHAPASQSTPAPGNVVENASGSASEPYCPLCVIYAPAGSTDAPPFDPAAPVTCALCHLKANMDSPPTLVLPPVFADTVAYWVDQVALPMRPWIALQRRQLGRAPPSFDA